MQEKLYYKYPHKSLTRQCYQYQCTKSVN